MLSEPKFGKLLEGELKTSARNLILTLYMLWPISIESALPTIDRKDYLEAGISFDIDKSCLEECLFKQVRHFVARMKISYSLTTHKLFMKPEMQANICKVIHDTVTSTLCESIEENATSYSKCCLQLKIQSHGKILF